MKHESLPPLNDDDAATDADKNAVLRDAIDEAARNDPTRFTTRSFAVLENKNHSLRLINRDDPRKAISIPWDELSALRMIIDIATQNTTSKDAAPTPPAQPEGERERLRFVAAEQVARAARLFCEELHEDAEGVPKLQLSELNAALDAWEAHTDARGSFDDSQPVMAALASLIEDQHATDHHRRVARLALTAIQNYDDEFDKELRRWQDGIRDKLIDLGAPADRIDGAGCDSGDPLDFTLAEVGQGVGWFIDQLDDARAAILSADTAAPEG